MGRNMPHRAGLSQACHVMRSSSRRLLIMIPINLGVDLVLNLIFGRFGILGAG